MRSVRLNAICINYLLCQKLPLGAIYLIFHLPDLNLLDNVFGFSNDYVRIFLVCFHISRSINAPHREAMLLLCSLKKTIKPVIVVAKSTFSLYTHKEKLFGSTQQHDCCASFVLLFSFLDCFPFILYVCSTG